VEGRLQVEPTDAEKNARSHRSPSKHTFFGSSKIQKKMKNRGSTDAEKMPEAIVLLQNTPFGS
jgi:hypothetical protein